MSGISWSPATTEVDADSHLFNIEDLKEAGLAHAEARRVLKECLPGPHVRRFWLDKPLRRLRCRRYLVAQIFKRNIGPHHGLCYSSKNGGNAITPPIGVKLWTRYDIAWVQRRCWHLALLYLSSAAVKNKRHSVDEKIV